METAKSRITILKLRASARAFEFRFCLPNCLLLVLCCAPMRNTFRNSLKSLVADIDLANTLASELQENGAFLQMKISYSPAAKFFLCLAKWTDCNLAGALGLLRILIYEVLFDGKGVKSTCVKKASIREFYSIIFPSLIQMRKGFNIVESNYQRASCAERYRKKSGDKRKHISEIDAEREEECGICMELNSKIVLPNCCHAMCLKCYNNWNSRQRSCPFCRESLMTVNPDDLWVYTDDSDVVDMVKVAKDDLQRLYLYINKLPSIGPSTNAVLNVDDSLDRTGSTRKLILSANTN